MKKGKQLKIGLEKLTIAKLSDFSKTNVNGGYMSSDCHTALEPESLDGGCPDNVLKIAGTCF